MDQNQNERRGGLFNFVNNTISGLRTAQFALPAASPSLLGIFIAVISILTVVTVSIVLENTGQASEGTQTETQQPLQSKATININDYFSITGGTSNDQTLIGDFIQEASSSLDFKKLLSGGATVSISFDIDPDLANNHPGYCGGSVVGSSITFYNFSTAYLCAPNDKKYLFFHELGHAIGNRNQRELYNPFRKAFLGSVDDPQPGLVDLDNQCYNSGKFLKSYEFSGEYGSIAGPVNESFAESVADSLLKKRKPFENFPSDCPVTYNWIASHVFSGQ